MKRGTIVAVCNDGKWGRRVKGEVIDTRNGHHIKIRFNSDLSDTPVEFWARRVAPVRHKRKVGECTWDMDHPTYYAGWANSYEWCPWFAVFKWKE